MAQTMFLQALTLQVIGSGLVGEPANETEKAPRRDGGSVAERTTKSAARIVGWRSIINGLLVLQKLNNFPIAFAFCYI